MKTKLNTLLMTSILTLNASFASCDLSTNSEESVASRVTLYDLPLELRYLVSGSVDDLQRSPIDPEAPVKECARFQQGFMDLETIRKFAEIDEDSETVISLAHGSRAVMALLKHQFTPDQLLKIFNREVNDEEAANLEKFLGMYSDEQTPGEKIKELDPGLVISMLALKCNIPEQGQFAHTILRTLPKLSNRYKNILKVLLPDADPGEIRMAAWVLKDLGEDYYEYTALLAERMATHQNASPSDLIEAGWVLERFLGEAYRERAATLYEKSARQHNDNPEVMRIAADCLQRLGGAYHERAAVLFEESATHQDALPNHFLDGTKGLKNLGEAYHERAARYMK
jgi:hypothetical protein